MRGEVDQEEGEKGFNHRQMIERGKLNAPLAQTGPKAKPSSPPGITADASGLSHRCLSI